MAQHLVTAPDGVQHIINAPDDATPEQVLAYAQQVIPQQLSSSFSDRVSKDFQNRKQEAAEINNAANKEQTSNIQAIPQLGGVGLGMLNDVIGEGAKSIYNATATQPTKEAFNDFGTAIKNNPIVQNISQKYQQFSQSNPNVSRDLNAAGNLVGLAANLTGTAEASDAAGGITKGAGNALYQSGQEAFQAKRDGFLQDLITPKQTPTVKSDQFSRSTEQGLLRNRIVQPTTQEQSIMATLSDLPVTKNKSLLANYNIINDAKNTEAQNLIDVLQKNDVTIPAQDILNPLADVRQSLANNPYITGNGAKAAESVINGALDHIANNPQTASGLLQSRKDFDTWVSNQKKESIFNPETEGPVSAAVQQVRQSINNIVDNAVPDVGVKNSLKKQSNMYRAMDAIETKGGQEGKNIISRATNKISSLLPAKTALGNAGAIAAGATGLAMAPAITGLAAGAYGAGKIVAAPITRKIIGKTLKGVGLTVDQIAKLRPAEANKYLSAISGRK